MSEPVNTPAKPGFLRSLMRMPLWQKAVLGLAVGVGAVGVTGQVMTQSTPPAPAPTVTETAPTTPPEGSRGFVSGQPQAQPAPPPAQTPAAEPTWLEKASPDMTKGGIGFVGAFLIGWMFRMFVKTMAFITAVVVALLLALSYFNVINIDFTAAKQQWSSAADWLSTQALHLKELAMAHLPASSSGAAGLAVGLTRK